MPPLPAPELGRWAPLNLLMQVNQLLNQEKTLYCRCRSRTAHAMAVLRIHAQNAADPQDSACASSTTIVNARHAGGGTGC
jgi:hypothetical protein